ncbi:MAG: hypothetical protein AB7C89_08650, partial [Intestinibacillus sp.]
MKKRFLALLLAAGMCVSLAACGGSGASGSGSGSSGDSGSKVTLKFNFVKASTDPEYQWYDEYFKGISEASGGEIAYELYPSEALGGSADVLEMASLGQAVVQDCDFSYLA